MHERFQFFTRRTLLPLGIATLLAGCSRTGDLPSDQLVVLTLNAPTTYFTDKRDQMSGPEYDMATAFGQFIHLPVRFVVMDSLGEVLDALKNGRGHLAAAGLTRTPERESLFRTGPTYQLVDELVVCGPGVEITGEADLQDVDLAVIADSSYVATLQEIQQRFPALDWTAVPGKSSEELLRNVADGVVDCTVADSNIVAVHRRYLPELNPVFPLDTGKELVWLLPPDAADLNSAVNEWFEEYKASGDLAAVINHYYGYLDQYDPYDVQVFERRVENRLPQYRPFFEKAGEETGFPWAFLAAVAYEESSWNPLATSPTGVRGMMMLTASTAESLGVSNRLDAASSIMGGARYLQRVYERVPPSIPEPDRLWMALAAYNIGYSHLRDARMLSVYLGTNPNLWSSVKQALPRLSERRYYRRVPAGYARGVGASIYVERIRNYYDLLGMSLE